MKNKAKLAFELLEQEMEVIYKEDLMKFIGGSGGYTWQQLFNDVNSGNFNNIPAGSYMVNSDGSTVTIYGGMLQEVVVTRNSSSGGYSSGGYSSNGYNWGGFTNYLSDPYFMNSQLWVGSGYSSGGYASGGGGYYVSPTYVPGSSTTTYPILNYDWENYSQWNLEAVADVFHGMGNSITNMGIVVTSTGIFSEVGVPLMNVGGAISLVGTGIDLIVDIRDNTPESFNYGAWAVQAGFEANSILFGKLTTTDGEKVIFELSQKGVEFVYESVMD